MEKARNLSDHQAGLGLFYERALEVARELPAGLPFIEIGTRAGGTALLLLEAIFTSGIQRPLITVDPYGKPYQSGPGEYLSPGQPNSCPAMEHYLPTGEEHYRTAMANLSSFAQEHGLNHVHYRMTSADFMDAWPHVMKLWMDGEPINERPFALVYLDGEHTPETVSRELCWLLPRMSADGLIVIDDTQHIRESKIAPIHLAFERGGEHGNRLYYWPAGKPAQNGRRALVTIAVGDAYHKIARLTHPTLRAYSERIGADFIVIDESTCSTPHWEKFRLYDLLGRYDRVIYLDTDIIVRPDTPDLFDIVPDQALGVFNESPFTPDRSNALVRACEDYDLTVRDWDGKYFNTGVMVLSRYHRYLFRKPEKETFNFFEQSYLNAIIAAEETTIFSLPYRFNRMTCLDSVTGEDRQESWIVHYAGWQNLAQTLSIIRGDLDRWERKVFSEKTFQSLDTRINGRSTPTRRHILIDVQGGLGDQVQAEPAIRWGLENVWQDADVDIKTHWPRIFQHLAHQADIFLHDEWVPKPDTPYYRACTLPGPDTPTWVTVSNLLCHTVDFCSIALLKRTLPMEARTVCLEVTPGDIIEAQNIAGEAEIGSLILVHAGWHWEGKTLPIPWWQSVINGLQADGLTVCLIGKNEDETRGVLPLVCPTGGIDARERTSLGGLFALIYGAGLLISNDSAPIHIAGANVIPLILIPTTKAPDHLLPYRRGAISWRTKALYRRPMWQDFVTAPNEWLDAGIVDRVPGGEEHWVDYLPDPAQVVQEAKIMFEKQKEHNNGQCFE